MRLSVIKKDVLCVRDSGEVDRRDADSRKASVFFDLYLRVHGIQPVGSVS